MAANSESQQQGLQQQQPEDSGSNIWESAGQYDPQQAQLQDESLGASRHRPSWGDAVAGYEGTRQRRAVYLNRDGTFDPLSTPDDPMGPMPTYMHSRPTFFQKIKHDPIYIPLIAGMTVSLGKGVLERIKGNPVNAPAFFMMRVAFGAGIIGTYAYSKARDQGDLLPWIAPKPYYL